MVAKGRGARLGLRVALVALAAVVTIVALGADPADARRRKKFRPAMGYAPPYAAIVVDANTGKILHDDNADARRHPASLTKVMTLYLLFEQIESGRLRLDSRLPVSEHAASMAPSKLGVRPGQTIEVEDAIKALVTKSANDVAAVIAEAIADDEDDFAKLMTRKARALGMSRTTYMNASGLPDPAQVTTARDQATLGRAIQDRFPRYYRYFATQRFHYRGRTIGNHNRLVGRVDGVDGIKTGYTRASGFNLVSSMKRRDRHVVAVVLGGRSGRIRDAQMHRLLESNIVEASARRTAPRVVEVAQNEPPRAKPARVAEQEPRAKTRVAAAFDAIPEAEAQPFPQRQPQPRQAFASAQPMMLASAPPSPPPGSAEPIKPTLVKTMTVKRGPSAVPQVQQDEPARTSAVARRVASLGVVPVAEPRPRVAKGEWVIQIGAFPVEAQANEKLKEARSNTRGALGRAEPFTERVMKGETALYRARFAGFDRDSADAACKQLKRNDFDCMVVRN